MDAEMRSTKSWFQKKDIHLCDEWLHGCISWYRQENRTYTVKELHDQVYEQWLLLDFRDVQVPILPANITNQKKQAININVCLQLMSVVDISRPKQWQINRIRNSNNVHNSDDENVSGKRVLQLLLTDGVQEILATEFRPVPFLNLNLTPGLKVRLNAPFTVRRGQVMLQPDVIKILGGEVEDLLVSNAAENVIAKFLNLPLNESPMVMHENYEEVKVETSSFTPQNQRVPSSKPPTITKEEEEELQMALAMDMIESKHTPTRKPSAADPFDDIDIPEEELVKIEAAASSTIAESQPGTSKNSAPLIFEDDFNPDDLEAMNEIEEMEKTTKQLAVSPTKKTTMPIAKLLSIKENVTKGKFTIHAALRSIVQKLTCSNGKFSLKIRVGDDSGEVDVYMDSDVICERIGISPEDMRRLQDGSLKNQAIVAKLLQGMNHFKETLVNLNSRMEILVEKNKDPVVKKLLP